MALAQHAASPRRAVASTRSGSRTRSLTARSVSTFMTRRMAVEMGITISLSRSMPWMSVPSRVQDAVDAERDGADLDLGARRVLVAEQRPGDRLADRAPPALRAGRRPPRRRTRPGDARGPRRARKRSDSPSRRTVVLASPRRTCGAGDDLHRVPGLDLGQRLGQRRRVVEREAGGLARGARPGRTRRPPVTTMAEGPKSWRTVCRSFRCAAAPIVSTNVSAATPIRLPSIMKAVRSLWRPSARRLLRRSRAVLMRAPRRRPAAAPRWRRHVPLRSAPRACSGRPPPGRG